MPDEMKTSSSSRSHILVVSDLLLALTVFMTVVPISGCANEEEPIQESTLEPTLEKDAADASDNSNVAVPTRPVKPSTQDQPEETVQKSLPKQESPSFAIPPPNPFLVTAPLMPTGSEIAEPKAVSELSTNTAELAELDPAIQVFKVAQPGGLFAYDPFSSHLAAIGKETGSVSFYSIGEKPELITRMPGPSNARAICTKRFSNTSYFVVGGENDRRILVFDATTCKLTSTIELQTSITIQLAASRSEDDPFVYYSSYAENERGSKEDYLGRFNLSTMEDEGALFNDDNDIAVSSDGSMIYTRDTGVSPTGLDAFRVVSRRHQNRHWDPGLFSRVSRFSLQKFFHDHTTTPAYTPGPHGAYIALGKKILSSSLEKEFGEFDFPIDCFIPSSPWVVGIDEGKLKIGSLNELKTHSQYQLPLVFKNKPLTGWEHQTWNEPSKRAAYYRKRRPAPVFYDPSRDRIIAAESNHLVILSLESVGLPDEPRLAVGIAGSSIVSSVNPTKIPLNTFDDRVKTRLVSAPAGFTVQNNEIKWSPLPDYALGEQDIIIERSFENLALQQPIRVLIKRDQISLPFLADYLRLSYDGTLALVLGRTLDSGGSETDGTDLAIVDTRTRKLKQSSHVKQDLLLAMIHKNAIYALEGKKSGSSKASVTKVSKYKLDDFSLVKSIEIKGMDRNLELTDQNTIYAGGYRFKLPSLSPADPVMKTPVDSKANSTYGEFGWYKSTGGRRGVGPTRKINGGWISDGVLWDDAHTRPRLLFRTNKFITKRASNSDLHPTAWGATYSERSVHSIGGDQFLSRSRRSPFGFAVGVSPTFPVAFAVPAIDKSKNDSNLRMPLYDLESGELSQSLSLGYGSQNYNRSSANMVDAAGDVLATCVEGSIYIVHRSEVGEPFSKQPFQFLLEGVGVELPFRREATVKYELVGGKPPYELSLTIDGVSGTAISKNAATFSIDTNEIASGLIAQMTSLQWPSLRDSSYRDPRDRVLKYLDAATPVFRRLAGRKPKGVPVAVTASVQARDASGKKAMFTHQFLLDLPAARVVEALGKSGSNRRIAATRRPPQSPRENNKGDQARVDERKRKREQARQLDLELAIAYAETFRENYPHEEVSPKEWEEVASDAREAIQVSLQPEIEAVRAALTRRVRTWSDRKGHKTKASLKSAFAGQVILRLTSGDDVTLPMEQLSEQDLKFIEKSNQEVGLGNDEHAELQTVLLLKMIHRHIKRTGSYPPAYVVNNEGKPILSWRVALLADMGGEQLLRLLRLDEPWDSQHNRRLLPFMPPIFGTSSEATQKGIATLLGINGSKTIFSDGRPMSPREIEVHPSKIVILAEVSADHGVEWTKPKDVSVSRFREISDIARDRNGNVVVGFAGGISRMIPTKTDAKHWRKAVAVSE